MENKPLYVVVRQSGEHYERHYYYQVASFDKERLEAFIVERKSKDNLRCKQHAALKAFRDAWVEQNPSPKYPTYLARPRWKSGLRKEEITPEMKAERDRVDAENLKISEAYDVVASAHFAKQSVAEQEFIRSALGITDSALIEEIQDYRWIADDEYSYSIEELDFLP